MTPGHLEWLHEYFIEMFQRPGLDKFLNPQIVELALGKIVLSMKITKEHSNIYGSVHGGTLASIADIAMGFPCLTVGKRVVTMDMNISYIKGVPTGSTVTAIGNVISNGNSIIRSVGEIYHEQELLASSHATYFIIGSFNKEDHPPPVF